MSIRDSAPHSSEDGAPRASSSHRQQPSRSSPPPARSRLRELFAVPAPVKELFDRFPLVTYPPDIVPRQLTSRGGETQLPTLYIYATAEDAVLGRPSFNPSCLKWQTFLKFAGVKFLTVSSNNHASPSGALPFLLPSCPGSFQTPLSPSSTPPIPSSKLHKWARDYHSVISEPADPHYEPYLSLVDHRIRSAWLYALYIAPSHSSLSQRFYIHPTTTNPFVRLTLLHQLRAAAEAELTKHTLQINVVDIYREAERAFEALSTLLGGEDKGDDGEGRWFFGQRKPGLFDASVFAYTHLILYGDEMGWWSEGERLVSGVRRRANLVRHRERVLGEFYASV